jgi:hypothetical protein
MSQCGMFVKFTKLDYGVSTILPESVPSLRSVLSSCN